MDDQGTFLTIGGGLVTVVVLATAFSSFIEGRAAKVEARSVMSDHVTEEAETLHHLRAQVDHARSVLHEMNDLKRVEVSCEAGKKSAAGRESRIATLVSRKAELNAAIAEVDEKFVKYRTEFRSSLWQAAAGESIGSLRTLDGRDYQSVTISKVTDDGIDIRHEHGVARIACDQLGENWHRRFQWSWRGAISSSK